MRPVLVLIVCAALLAASCGSDHHGSVVRSLPPRLEEPDAFLDRLAVAYSDADTAAYFAMLDTAFVFEMDAGEWVEAGLPARTWDRAKEAVITRRIMGATQNAEGEWVDEIRLNLLVKSVAEDRAAYDGRSPGEIWYQVTALAEFEGVVVDPIDVTITTYRSLAPQRFVVRPDPQGSGRYLIVRQSDTASGTDAGAGAEGSVPLSWGLFKARYY